MIERGKSGTAYAIPQRQKHNTQPHVEDCVVERRNSMTMINEVLINGSLYVCSLGVLGLAWASLQRSKR